MSPSIPIPAEDLVVWEFQVEKQGFITRYGFAGYRYFKQVILQSGLSTDLYTVKHISPEVYNLAKRLASSLK